MTAARDPVAAVEAFIAGIDGMSGQLTRSSLEIAEGLKQLAAAESDLLASQASLREQLRMLASGSESSSQSATTALEAIAARTPPGLRADRTDPTALDTTGLEATASGVCESITGAATHLADGGFSTLARGAEQLAADIDDLDPQTSAAVQSTVALCQALPHRLANAREELSAALRDAGTEGAGSALTVLEESLRELQLFGEDTSASFEALFTDISVRTGQSIADLRNAAEVAYAEWLTELERLTTEAASQLRGALTERIETHMERLKQEAVRDCNAAVEDAHTQAESVEAGAPKAEALVPQVAAAKQACLTMAEVMGAMGF